MTPQESLKWALECVQSYRKAYANGMIAVHKNYILVENEMFDALKDGHAVTTKPDEDGSSEDSFVIEKGLRLITLRDAKEKAA